VFCYVMCSYKRFLNNRKRPKKNKLIGAIFCGQTGVSALFRGDIRPDPSTSDDVAEMASPLSQAYPPTCGNRCPGRGQVRTPTPHRHRHPIPSPIPSQIFSTGDRHQPTVGTGLKGNGTGPAKARWQRLTVAGRRGAARPTSASQPPSQVA